jgi:hypothetical protein
MLPLLFELVNHLHKRPVQLGKVIKKQQDPQTSQQRPKLKQKIRFLWGWGGQIAYQNHRKSVKKVSLEKKGHGLMLLVKKNHQKPPGT